jgi:hypothetical protein
MNPNAPTPRTDALILQLRRDAEPSGCNKTLDFACTLERELAEAKADAASWKKKFKDLDHSLMCELRDPNGTIWECAKALQDERDQLRASVAELEQDKAVLNYALGFIVKHGGMTHDTELGPIHCDGFWCAEQARAAIYSARAKT